MVNARLVSGPMNFNEEQLAAPSPSVDSAGVNPGPPDEGAVGQLYRSLARNYAGEIQRHQLRRKRMVTGVVVLGAVSFLGLMALSYWGSV